jgi:adenosylcobinamide-GDP ribazoletransferase
VDAGARGRDRIDPQIEIDRMEYADRTLNSMRRLLLAVGMLTPWRVSPGGDPTPGDLRQSTAFYPLVGLGVGLLPAGALLLPVPAMPRAVLALAAWVLATGALHLRGWARCCDAAFAPVAGDAEAAKQRRLEVLRDPRLGVFGMAGLVLLMLGKWTALVHAPAFAPLVAAPLARWGMVHALRTYVAARPEGMGARLAGPVPLWTATWIAVAVLGLVTFASPDPSQTGVAVTVGTAALLVCAAFLVDRFGGITFGACGAAAELAELAVLWAFLPWGSG